MKKLLILVTLFLISLICANAQELDSPKDLDMIIELVHQKVIPESVSDTLVDMMHLLSPSDSIFVKALVESLDTINLSNIHVKLGTIVGSGDLVEHSFVYGDTIPDVGFTYFRDGHHIEIGLGAYPYSDSLYLEVFFEDNQGQVSDTVSYEYN